MIQVVVRGAARGIYGGLADALAGNSWRSGFQAGTMRRSFRSAESSGSLTSCFRAARPVRLSLAYVRVRHTAVDVPDAFSQSLKQPQGTRQPW